MDYSERIIRLRKEHGLTQEELAQKLMISRQAVSLWEQGKNTPSIDNLLRIKELYGISVDAWLSDASCSDTDNASDSLEHRNRVRTVKLVIPSLVFAVLLIIAAGNLIYNWKLLYGTNADFQYTCIAPIHTGDAIPLTGQRRTLLEPSSGPRVTGVLPDRFVLSDGSRDVYVDAEGNFVCITAGMDADYLAALTGTEGYAYLYALGIQSAMEMDIFVLDFDVSEVGLLSSRKSIRIASAVKNARLLLHKGDTEYCMVYDESLRGYALHFDGNVWRIRLCTPSGNWCDILINDSSLTRSANHLAAFLATVEIEE